MNQIRKDEQKYQPVFKRRHLRIYLLSNHERRRGGENLGVLIKLMNQISRKVNFYTNHLNRNIFSGGKNSGGTNIGGKNFGPLKKFRFPTIIIFVIFWTGGKNSPDCLEKKS